MLPSVTEPLIPESGVNVMRNIVSEMLPSPGCSEMLNTAFANTGPLTPFLIGLTYPAGIDDGSPLIPVKPENVHCT